MHTTALAICVLLASFSSLATASASVNFLKSGLIAEADVKDILSSKLAASSADERVHAIVDSLKTMYMALPKNAKGTLDHQAVRYALHRFFVHRYGWFIRGLEPNNDTWHGALDPDAHNSSFMKEWVPSYLQDILEQRIGIGGTDLHQLAASAAALEDLVQQEVVGRLEATYRMHAFPEDKVLNEEEAASLITTYYVGFLVATDFTAGSVREMEYKKDEFTSQYVGWPEAEEWLRDLSKAHLQPQQKLQGRPGYAFMEIKQLVSKIGQDYYKFNDKECGDLKQTLRGMQGKKPGRVRLSTFYHKGMYTHWHFTEKADYLKALGALDDSDPKQPFVIIANYAMARSNCLDSSNLYTICCRNECEDLMQRLEGDIGDSAARPERIASLVEALPSPTVEAPRNLSAGLMSRLKDVAEQHGGQVPMHGRLFAQWMHHAYPLECPYPHEFGAANPQTPDEWMKDTGHESELASADEMMEQVARDTCAVDASGKPDCAEETADIPWSNNEELLTWHPRNVVSLAAKSAASQPSLVAALMVESLLGLTGIVAAFIVVKEHTDHALEGDDNAKGRRSSRGRLVPLFTLTLLSLIAYLQGLLDGCLFVGVLVCGGIVVAAQRHAHHLRKRAPQRKCDV